MSVKDPDAFELAVSQTLTGMLLDKLQTEGKPVSVKIWYSKPEAFNKLVLGFDLIKKMPGLHIRLRAKHIEETHVLLCDIVLPIPTGADETIETLKLIFRGMQAFNWSPEGEAMGLIRAKGLHHTSMCVGDVIQIASNLYFVDTFGFRLLS